MRRPRTAGPVRLASRTFLVLTQSAQALCFLGLRMRKVRCRGLFRIGAQERTRPRTAGPVRLASRTFLVLTQSAQALCFLGLRMRKVRCRGLFRIGAQERTRTSTVLPPLGPEPSASTNSATWAVARNERLFTQPWRLLPERSPATDHVGERESLMQRRILSNLRHFLRIARYPI